MVVKTKFLLKTEKITYRTLSCKVHTHKSIQTGITAWSLIGDSGIDGPIRASVIDASENGTCVVLEGSFDVKRVTAAGPRNIYVFDVDGNKLSNFPGNNRTQDVAIDRITESIFSVGRQNKTMFKFIHTA